MSLVRTLLDKYFIKQPKLRRAVTAALEREKDVDVDLCGTTLHINTRREHGYLRASRMVAANGTLRDEIPVLMNLFALLRDGDTFVDVGANVGLYARSVVRLTQVYPRLRVIALEANPTTFVRLSHGLAPEVRALQLAASDRSGTTTFVDGAVSHVFTQTDHANAYNIRSEGIEVRTERLDALELEGNSLFLKIDVEGQEQAVLEGATGLFDAGRVRAVYLDGYGARRGEASPFDWLAEKGFDLLDGRSLRRAGPETFSLLAIKAVDTQPMKSAGTTACAETGPAGPRSEST